MPPAIALSGKSLLANGAFPWTLRSVRQQVRVEVEFAREHLSTHVTTVLSFLPLSVLWRLFLVRLRRCRDFLLSANWFDWGSLLSLRWCLFFLWLNLLQLLHRLYDFLFIREFIFILTMGFPHVFAEVPFGDQADGGGWAAYHGALKRPLMLGKVLVSLLFCRKAVREVFAAESGAFEEVLPIECLQCCANTATHRSR